MSLFPSLRRMTRLEERRTGWSCLTDSVGRYAEKQERSSSDRVRRNKELDRDLKRGTPGGDIATRSRCCEKERAHTQQGTRIREGRKSEPPLICRRQARGLRRGVEVIPLLPHALDVTAKPVLRHPTDFSLFLASCLAIQCTDPTFDGFYPSSSSPCFNLATAVFLFTLVASIIFLAHRTVFERAEVSCQALARERQCGKAAPESNSIQSS